MTAIYVIVVTDIIYAYIIVILVAATVIITSYFQIR